MPTDLSHEEHDLIRVLDRDGTGLPFSRGIMATSILATGLETGRAYRIAAEIDRELRRNGQREIDSAALALLAERTIAHRAGDHLAMRYRAWRDARHGGRPIILCLGGAPGVGKSTIATRLALRLGINRVVPTDAIREVLRTVVPDTVLPELHVSTFESLETREGGAASPSVFLRQARAVSAAAAAVAGRLATEGRHAILEGVHLLPGEVTAALRDAGSPAIVVELLFVQHDAELHRGQLLRRARTEPARRGGRHLERFDVIRALQDELRRRALVAGVPEHDIGHPESLTPVVVDRVAAAVDVASIPASASA